MPSPVTFVAGITTGRTTKQVRVGSTNGYASEMRRRLRDRGRAVADVRSDAPILLQSRIEHSVHRFAPIKHFQLNKFKAEADR